MDRSDIKYCFDILRTSIESALFHDFLYMTHTAKTNKNNKTYMF